MPRSIFSAAASLTGLLALSSGLWLAQAEESTKLADNKLTDKASDDRLGEGVRYLASDELQGRGVGTEGIDKAADYIAREFAAMGLDTKAVEGGPFQKFQMTIGADEGKANELKFIGPEVKEGESAKRLVLVPSRGKDFNPLALGGSGKLDAPLVFAGYGITDKEKQYDDYAGLDVKGKVVIVLRHEPQQDKKPGSPHGGAPSMHAPFSRKLSNAYEHGAAGVIFCTDEQEIQSRVASRRQRWQRALDDLTEAEAKLKKAEGKPTLADTARELDEFDALAKEVRDQAAKVREEFDPLIGFQGAGSSSDVGRIPAVHCRREAIDRLLEAAKKTTLAALERQIDEGPKPQSFELSGWQVTGEITVNRRETAVKNVIAILPGQGPLADETVVVGAHYDHLGLGGEGSLAPGKSEIHNGADDNASGASALLEVARLCKLHQPPPKRTIVFIAFTGEERGLIGSSYYCRHPIRPLDRTVAMLNMDMVGRLDDDKLIVQGVDTSPEFGPLIDATNQHQHFKITRQPGGFGPSDHSSFYAQKIPVMHFFTGAHKDYHRPSDDFDKINVAGMRRVAEMVAEAAEALATAEQRPEFVQTKAPASMGGGDRPYFGSIPDFAPTEPGYWLSGVTHAGPAEKGGLKAGDGIIRLGDSRIGNLEDFDSALRKHKAGEKVPVVVKRAGQELTLTVTLDPPR